MTEPTWWRRRPGCRGETRRFTVDLVLWRVFEYACALDTPGETSLIFACEAMWRRLRDFPSDWATRDDVALFALSPA